MTYCKVKYIKHFTVLHEQKMQKEEGCQDFSGTNAPLFPKWVNYLNINVSSFFL